MNIKPPEYASLALRTLESCGFEAYLVGGCLRDAILGRRPLDWDICTSALPEAVIRAFPRSYPTGIKHGTVTVISRGHPLEVTSYRADGAYSDHRRPDAVEFTASLEEDLARRDFTINAMALSSDGRIIDPFGGISDIERRIIRCVGDPDRRFSEDALRMLRALRFSAVLDFEIEPNTMAAISSNAPLLKHVSAERKTAELAKALLSNRPEMTVSMLELCGLIPHTALFEDRRTKRITRLRKKKDLRLAALCALLMVGGALTDPAGFTRSLRLDSETAENAARGALTALENAPSSELEWKRLLVSQGQSACDCAAAALCVLRGFGAADTYKAVLSSGDCLGFETLAVRGRDLVELGLRGPSVGRTLAALLEHVLVNPEDNRRDILLELARKLPHG